MKPTDEFESDGYQAYWDGYLLSENPHDEDTDRWHGWRRGWACADKEYQLQQGDGVPG